MKVVNGWPPNIEEIREVFGTQRIGVVYAWGDVVYTPFDERPLPPDLEVHEATHFRQQAEIGGPEVWWERYLADTEFRLAQEIEAYRAQVMSVTDKRRRRALRLQVAQDLAGPIYGNIISLPDALKALS